MSNNPNGKTAPALVKAAKSRPQPLKHGRTDGNAYFLTQ